MNAPQHKWTTQHPVVGIRKSVTGHRLTELTVKSLPAAAKPGKQQTAPPPSAAAKNSHSTRNPHPKCKCTADGIPRKRLVMMSAQVGPPAKVKHDQAKHPCPCTHNKKLAQKDSEKLPHVTRARLDELIVRSW